MLNNFDTIVNRNEANALKELIFRRVRERSQSMNEDFQAETMDMARDSFVSQNNPFSKIIEQTQPEPASEPVVQMESKQTEEIGFPIREHKTGITAQSRLINEQMASAAVADSMIAAREALSNNKSFMGALNFLNSQAAISLIKTRADKFEMLA